MLTQYCVGTVAESFPQTEQKGQQNQTFLYEIVSKASYLLHDLCANYESEQGCNWYCGAETKSIGAGRQGHIHTQADKNKKTRQIVH